MRSIAELNNTPICQFTEEEMTKWTNYSKMTYAIKLLETGIQGKAIEMEAFKHNTNRVKKVKLEMEALELALKILEA